MKSRYSRHIWVAVITFAISSFSTAYSQTVPGLPSFDSEKKAEQEENKKEPEPIPGFDPSFNPDQPTQGPKPESVWEGDLFGKKSYEPGTEATIEAVANPGFEFDHWEGNQVLDPTQAHSKVSMTGHTKIKAHWKRLWNVIAAPDKKEAGKVEGSGNFPDGTEVKLKVTPNEGFKFLGWEGKGVPEESKEELNITIIVDGDHDIVAKFENEDQDQNQDQNNDDQQDNQDQNQDQDNQDNQDQNEDQQDQNEDESEQNEDKQDPEQNKDEPSEPEEEKEDPAEPEEEKGEDEPTEPEEEEGQDEEQPAEEEPAQEEKQPGQEEPAAPGEEQAGQQPLPLQMTPEEALRLLDAMEGEEKKLPIFITTPPSDKKDPKKDW